MKKIILYLMLGMVLYGCSTSSESTYTLSDTEKDLLNFSASSNMNVIGG